MRDGCRVFVRSADHLGGDLEIVADQEANAVGRQVDASHPPLEIDGTGLDELGDDGPRQRKKGRFEKEVKATKKKVAKRR